MKIQERLEAMQRQRENAVNAMQGIFDKSAAEERSFDGAEQTEFDKQKDLIKGLDVQIENVNVLARASLGQPATSQAANGSGAVDVSKGMGSVDLGAATNITVHRTLPKGTAFTRYAMALASAKGNVMGAAEVAKRWAGSTPEVETILRAAVAAGTTTDAAWAKPLVPYQDMQSELIELLRPETVIGRMTGFRNIPFNVRMPRQTAGSSVSWVGQGAPKPVTRLSFETITVPHAKIAAIIAITDELARMSTPSAEAAVRQDLIQAIAQYMDVQFLDPTVAAVADVSPGAITNGITGVDSTGATVAAVTADLNTALTAMAVANIGMRNPYWIMNPRTANALSVLRTTQDIFAFREEMNAGVKRLMGIPVIVSNNVPLRDQNAGGGTEGYIVLVDASEIFMADDGETMLDVSREASLQMDTAPAAGPQALVSLWQNNLVGIRAERYVYWQRRNNAAVYLIDMVAY